MQQRISATGEQQHRDALKEGLTQLRLEGIEPHPVFYELAEQYIRGEITIEEALALLKEQVQVVHESE